MENRQEDIVKSFIEVRLKDNNPDNFLKVRETLTRIGIASKYQKKLYQSCHILCKYKTRYFIVHFKQLFQLDGKPTDFTENDRARVNTIANLLASWGLIELVEPDKSQSPVVPVNQIKIIPFKEKNEWNLTAKYTIGVRKPDAPKNSD
jgi:hypothetical protein